MSNDIVVHDNTLESDLDKELQDFFSKVEWKYGSKSTGLSLPHLSKYFYSSKDLKGENVDDVHFQEECIEKVYQVIKTLIPTGSKIIRCYANAHTPGLEGRVHIDDRREGTTTVIYYPMMAWNVDWGGDTMFWDHINKEIIRAIIPKPNRIIVFSSNIWHSMRPLSRYCPMLRITLMFKFSHTDESFVGEPI